MFGTPGSKAGRNHPAGPYFEWDPINHTLRVTGGTVTQSTPLLNMTQTWNNSAVHFVGSTFDITNIASDWQSSFIKFNKDDVLQAYIHNSGDIGCNAISGPAVSAFAGAAYWRIAHTETNSWSLTVATGTTLYSGGSQGNVLNIDNSTNVGWGTSSGGAITAGWFRDANDTIAQRRGTNAQTYRIYGTWTDASNYERLSIGYDTGDTRYEISTEEAGTGTLRGLTITASPVNLVATTGDVLITALGGHSSFTGTGQLSLDYSGGVNLGPGETIYWFKDADGIIAQRTTSGSTPQSYRWYNTRTDASNYERLSVGWSSNVAIIATEEAGTGTLRELKLKGSLYTIGDGDNQGIGIEVRNQADSLYAPVEASDFVCNGGIAVHGTYIGLRDGTAGANMPTPADGQFLYINDADTTTYGSTVTGGGSGNAIIWYDGTNWKVMGGTPGGGGAPGGASGTVQYNNGGTLGGMSGTSWDDTNRSLTMTGATVTTSEPILDLTQTWNDSGVTFTGLKFNVTDTASAAGSKLFEYQLAGEMLFSLDKIAQLRLHDITNEAHYGTLYCLAGSGSIAIGSSLTGGGERFTFTISTGVFGISANNAIRWSSAGSSSTGSYDVSLWRDAASVLAFRDDTTAQTFRVYNTWTDASNYERLSIGWSGNVCTIGFEEAGTGSPRQVFFKPTTDNAIVTGRLGGGFDDIYVGTIAAPQRVAIGTNGGVYGGSVRIPANGAFAITDTSGDASATLDIIISRIAAGQSGIEGLTALTNTVNPALKLRHTTSGTPASGIGLSIQFEQETATTPNYEIGATIAAVTTDVGSGTEDFDITVNTMAAGAAVAERLRVGSLGVKAAVRIYENEVILTDTAPVPLDASLGNTFKLVAASADRTISVPTNNPASGQVQKIVIMFEASGANRTLTLTTGAGGFRFGTDITALTVTTSGLVDYIGAIYNDADDRWDVVSYVKGF